MEHAERNKAARHGNRRPDRHPDRRMRGVAFDGPGPKHPPPNDKYIELAYYIAKAVPARVDAVIALINNLQAEKPGPIMLENGHEPDRSKDRRGKPMLIEHRTTKDVGKHSSDGRQNDRTGTDKKGNL